MAIWWIDEPFLAGSSNPSDLELEALRDDGFSTVVCLLDEDQQAPGYREERAVQLGYTRYCFPVRDFHAPTVSQLHEFVRLIRSTCPSTKVVVHCEGGTGRTGTFAAAYWVAKGLSASEAIERVRRARPHAVETAEQRQALEQFARICANPSS